MSTTIVERIILAYLNKIAKKPEKIDMKNYGYEIHIIAIKKEEG